MAGKTTKKSNKSICQGLSNSNLVQKSRPLLLMKEVPFSLGELKVLDTYLSRINSHNEDNYTVTFSKEEYEDLMGIGRMHPQRLEKYVKTLMGQTVTIPDESTHRGWRLYTLFDMAECYKDNHEQWWIDLSCTPNAKRLFFNIESLGYIRYQLKNVINLTSKYSALLYLYLLENRYRKQWKISVTELRTTVFRCAPEYYREFKRFKDDILNKALNEVNERTDITFAMSTTAKGCKAGRSIINVEFTLIKENIQIPKSKEPDEQLVLDCSDNDDSEHEYSSNNMELLASACNGEFSPEEIDVLFSLITIIPLPEHKHGIWIARYHYLNQKYATLILEASKRKIVHRFSYMKTLVVKDLQKCTVNA